MIDNADKLMRPRPPAGGLHAMFDGRSPAQLLAWRARRGTQ